VFGAMPSTDHPPRAGAAERAVAVIDEQHETQRSEASRVPSLILEDDAAVIPAADFAIEDREHPQKRTTS
jgi:hypothetical protein